MDNQVEKNNQMNECLIQDVQVNEDWPHIPIDDNWSFNVETDQTDEENHQMNGWSNFQDNEDWSWNSEKLNEENSQISEWDTIQPPNTQVNGNWFWNFETFNKTDQNDDEEWLKPNPQVIFVETKKNKKIDVLSTIHHVDVKPLSNAEKKKYQAKTLPIEFFKDIPKSRNEWVD